MSDATTTAVRPRAARGGSSKAQRFTHLGLENWRNFRHVDVDLQGRAFLVGPNASGKSNLLEAFRFLHDVSAVGGGFQKAVADREGVSSLRCLAERRYSDVVLRATIDGAGGSTWEYLLAFSQDNQRRPMIKRERVARDGEELLGRPNEEDDRDPERLTQTYLEQVHANQPFRAVSELFQSIRYLHIVPQMFAQVRRKSGRQILVSTHSFDLLRDEGIGLDEVLLLEPSPEGTTVSPASSFRDIQALPGWRSFSQRAGSPFSGQRNEPVQMPVDPAKLTPRCLSIRLPARW